MRLLPLLCLAACDSSSDTAVEDDDLDVVARVGGFEVPESVLCDEDATCYVSNIVGNGADEDGDGYLSRITPDGVVLDRRWTSGVLSLDAPKGMAIVDGVLYVVDITRICALEIATSTPRYPTAVDAAAFLNDVAAGPDGTLYLTDTANGQVFAWDRTGEPEPLHEPGTLDAPNGIRVHENALWVASFGAASLYELNLRGDLVATHDLPAGRLDGLVVDREGRFLVSSWDTSAVYAGSPGGDWDRVAEDLPGPADLGYDALTHRLFVPLFDRGRVVVFQLEG